MTAQELYNQEDFEDFICEFEDKWMQYSNEETKIKAYFGSLENGVEIFEKWKTGSELFSKEREIAFS